MSIEAKRSIQFIPGSARTIDFLPNTLKKLFSGTLKKNFNDFFFKEFNELFINLTIFFHKIQLIHLIVYQ